MHPSAPRETGATMFPCTREAPLRTQEEPPESDPCSYMQAFGPGTEHSRRRSYHSAVAASACICIFDGSMHTSPKTAKQPQLPPPNFASRCALLARCRRRRLPRHHHRPATHPRSKQSTHQFQAIRAAHWPSALEWSWPVSRSAAPPELGRPRVLSRRYGSCAAHRHGRIAVRHAQVPGAGRRPPGQRQAPAPASQRQQQQRRRAARPATLPSWRTSPSCKCAGQEQQLGW